MTSRDFAYWLQGFFEITGESLETIQKPQVEQIKKHLAMVFVHEIDPSHGDAEHQQQLNTIHEQPPVGEVVMNASEAFYQANPHLRPNQNRPEGAPVYRC